MTLTSAFWVIVSLVSVVPKAKSSSSSSFAGFFVRASSMIVLLVLRWTAPVPFLVSRGFYVKYLGLPKKKIYLYIPWVTSRLSRASFVL